jgi:thiamine biosynthesis lipoprotein
MSRPLAYILPAGLLVALSGAAMLRAPSPPNAEPPPTSFSGFTMGCTWSVKLARPPAADLQSSIQSLLDRLNAQMSNYLPDSDLSRFNACPSTDWQPAPPDLANVVAQSLQISAQTHGAFDITVAPLVNLWGFGPQPAGLRLGHVPTDTEIAAACAHVNYQHLHARPNPPALKKDDPALQIDLGGIAKGYAADAVAAHLDSLGIADYLVTIGGEVKAKGLSPSGRPWQIGIETPTPDVRRVLLTLPLRDLALSTSGDYRNFFTVNGRRYCHEINPLTGRPIDPDTSPASVSVAHPSATYADAYATALIVLGPNEGHALANKLHLRAIFILRARDHFDSRPTPEFQLLTNP